MTTNTPHALYVVLPNNDHDKPVAYTSNADAAPLATRDQISPAQSVAINTAHVTDMDATNCAKCNTPVGYHFVAVSDPEEFRNTGFFVALNGTILCEECA